MTQRKSTELPAPQLPNAIFQVSILMVFSRHPVLGSVVEQAQQPTPSLSHPVQHLAQASTTTAALPSIPSPVKMSPQPPSAGNVTNCPSIWPTSAFGKAESGRADQASHGVVTADHGRRRQSTGRRVLRWQQLRGY